MGNYIVAGSKDRKAYFFNKSGKLLWSYETGDSVSSVAISSDGNYIVAGSKDRKAYFFNRSGELLWSYETGDSVSSVAISSDRKYVTIGAGSRLYYVATHPIDTLSSLIKEKSHKLSPNLISHFNSKLESVKRTIKMRKYEKAQIEAENLADEIKRAEELYEKAKNKIDNLKALVNEAETIGYKVEPPIAFKLFEEGKYEEAIEKAEESYNAMVNAVNRYKEAKQLMDELIEKVEGEEVYLSKEYKEQYNKALKLFENGEYDKSIKILKFLLYFKLGMKSISPSELMEFIEYEEEIGISRLEFKPNITIDLKEKELIFNHWSKVSLEVRNDGNVIAKDIIINFFGDVKVKGLTELTLKPKSKKLIELDIKPTALGNIPLDVEITYIGLSDEKLRKTQTIRINVKTEATTPYQELTPAEFTPKPLSTTSIPPELAVNYKNIELIGQGGFARVFKAVRVKDNLPVAIKIPISLDSATGKSFIKELENWTKLNHPNIVKVYDYNILPIPYFEMELCDESLDEYLKRKKILDVKEASYLIFNIAEGLKYAHSLNIIHKDLKPHNILLKNGIPKISDWGLSKVLTQSTSTTRGALTPYYASPEQFSKKFGKIDCYTDIWQLGVIFYQLTTGKLPFEGDDFIDLMTSITTEEPIHPKELNPDIPKETENIILKCLNKNPKDRYQTMLELQRDLATYLQISFKEELNKSISINDFSKSAFYCGELFLVYLKINDGVNAYKFCGDLINHAKGEIKNDLIKLKEMIKYRVENKLPIPNEIISSAEVIVHKIKLGFDRE
ncbi:serine/threonine protein kinase with WD40 repeats [Methanotorris formicicus Mc-S-70]|uniref:Serine/threonine protein kinase with WD40 repeats n=1 Tax=Methanotorris formicicus Mc-S-70 TaxID=647171 RepID=H1L0Y3_9EURY|nr:serine/threonine protein kinase with WD40 repeats [Methanotorris formicicus Mc-S-70]